MNIDHHILPHIPLGEIFFFCSAKYYESKIQGMKQRIAFQLDTEFQIKICPAPTPELEGCMAFSRILVFGDNQECFTIITNADKALHYNAFYLSKIIADKLQNILETDVPLVEFISGFDGPPFGENCCEKFPRKSYSIAPPVNPSLPFNFDEDHSIESSDVEFEYDSCCMPDLASPCMPAPISDDDFESPFTTSQISEDEIDLGYDNEQKYLLDKLTSVILDYVARYHEMPPIDKIAGKIINGKLSVEETDYSPIVVNGDLRIILPNWNEMEIKMTPLARTVYILFLMHPEGILLKDIGDYHDELAEIYSLVKPGAMNARQAIDELATPSSDSLRQKISMVRRAIDRAILNPRMARRYHISGTRGNLYSVSGIPPTDITIPAALRRQGA